MRAYSTVLVNAQVTRRAGHEKLCAGADASGAHGRELCATNTITSTVARSGAMARGAQRLSTSPRIRRTLAQGVPARQEAARAATDHGRAPLAVRGGNGGRERLQANKPRTSRGGYPRGSRCHKALGGPSTRPDRLAAKPQPSG